MERYLGALLEVTSSRPQGPSAKGLWIFSLKLKLCASIVLIAGGFQPIVAQHVGFTAGLLGASKNLIAPSGDATVRAELLGPGFFLGGFYMARDSEHSFRLEAGWEHQNWRQSFQEQLHPVWPYETSTRTGLMNLRLDILRLVPQVALAVGKRTYVVLGPDLGIILHARTIQDGTTTNSTGNFGPHEGSSTTVESDSTFFGTQSLNNPQLGIRIGMEQVVGMWSVGGAFEINTSLYLRSTHGSSRDLVPMFWRLSIGRRLWSR